MEEKKTTDNLNDQNDKTVVELTPEDLGITEDQINELINTSPVIVVNINETEKNHLEGLQMDLEAMKSLLAFMMSTDCPYKLDQDKVNEMQVKYSNKFREHQVIMNHIANKYRPEGLSDNYTFNISFRDCTITYVKQ